MNLELENKKLDLCEFFKKEDLDIVNRWILSRFYSVLKEVDRILTVYKFNEAANALYGFFWHEFCDWYLEMIKSDIKSRNNQVVMYKVLEKFLRVMHPFMPFITEEIWHRLQPEQDSIMIQPWPHIQEQVIDRRIETKMNMLFELITEIRKMRQELDIPLQKEVALVISADDRRARELIEGLSVQLKSLAKLSSLEVKAKYTHIKSSLTVVVGDMHLSIPLSGILDLEKEKLKVDVKIRQAEAEIKTKERTLDNKEFVKKAPLEVVEKEKARLKELGDILKRLKAIKDELR
jgi:valyl-tRNA synthetase